MDSSLIDLRPSERAVRDDVGGLQGRLAQLVGELFRFARVSYGDELTLHFGDLRPARSAKLKGKLYGVYILGVRGSSWLLKSGGEPLLVAAGDAWDLQTPLGKPLDKNALEAGTFVEPGSRVLQAQPFVVKVADAYGLQLRLSDGSALVVLPSPPEPDEAEDEGLPPLADWELLTPHGLLTAGPSLQWSFTPKSAESKGRTDSPAAPVASQSGPPMTDSSTKKPRRNVIRRRKP